MPCSLSCFNSIAPLLPILGSRHSSQTTAPISSPIFHGCVNEHLADRTPSPTFSTTDSEITEMADERQSEMSDLIDDEAFVDDTSSDAGTEEGSDIFSDGQDPFYDRSPWFILVGRLVTVAFTYRLGQEFGADVGLVYFLFIFICMQIQSKEKPVKKIGKTEDVLDYAL